MEPECDDPSSPRGLRRVSEETVFSTRTIYVDETDYKRGSEVGSGRGGLSPMS